MIPATSNADDATRQATASAERLAQAFLHVFGPNEEKRSAPQKLVIEHLKYIAGDDAACYRFNEAKDGIALIAAGIHRDGAQLMLRVIDRQLRRASQPRAEAPKPKTIKRK